MTITIAANSVPKPPAEIIEGFRGAPTSVISDNLARLPGAVGLKPYHRGGKLVGTAFTVRTRPGDNLAIHRALELVGPGDVIVVDGGGDETRALVGEIMKNIAQWRKAEGYVIDGAIRDVAAFAADDFPCYARAVIHRGPYKNGPGEINVPVTIGGSVISPGDIVVGDEDGVVSFPAAGAAALLEAVRAQVAREEETHEGDPRGPLPGLCMANPDQIKNEGEGGVSQKDEFHNIDDPSDGLFPRARGGGDHAHLLRRAGDAVGGDAGPACAGHAASSSRGAMGRAARRLRHPRPGR